MSSDAIYDREIQIEKYPDIIPYDADVHPRGNTSSCVTKERYPYGKADSTENVILKAMWVHGTDRYDYRKVEFIGKLVPVTIICHLHGEFEQTPSVHLSGSGCKECAAEKYKERRMRLLEDFKEVHGDMYSYHLVDFDGMKSIRKKIPIYCKEHDHVFHMVPHSHIYGSKCPKCSKKHRRTADEWKKDIEEIYKDQPWLDFSDTDFHRVKTKVSFYCHNHKKTITKEASSLLNGNGCNDCDLEKQMELNRIKRVEQIKEIYLDYGRFVYDLDSLYDKDVPIWMTCNDHKVSFKTSPYAHWLAETKNCPLCFREKTLKRLTHDTEHFIQRSKAIHGEDAFDYSKTEYVRSTSPVTLICNKDGWQFQITPQSHFSKTAGCPKCSGKIRWTTDKWIEYAKEKRTGEGFDYSSVEYRGAFIPVKIKCQNGHLFEQTPDNHINGMKGCNYCKTPSMYYGDGGYYDDKTKGYFYIIRFYNDEEEFIKVGISKNIDSRFKGKQYSCYMREEVFLSRSMPIREALELEQSILSLLRSKGLGYKPKRDFHGSSECFVPESIDDELFEGII